jgi:hypothetical protein
LESLCHTHQIIPYLDILVTSFNSRGQSNIVIYNPTFIQIIISHGV